MSDAFDPDAWPHTPASGGSRPEGDDVNDDLAHPQYDDDDDDYDALNVDAPQGGYGSDPPAAGAPTFDDAPQGGYGDAPQGQDDNLNDDTYDFDYDQPTTTQPRAAANDDYDDYGYDSYDDDDNNYNDNQYNDFDDDFEEGHRSSGGIRKFLIAGVGVVAVLLLLVVGMSALGNKKGSNSASGTTTTAAGGSSSTVAGTTTPAPADVMNALNQSLSAWGQFAVDGNLDDVRPYFVNSGPQFTEFQSEAPDIAGSPPGGAPLTMTMTNPTSVKDGDNDWLIKGTVMVTRAGDANQSFPWEIHLNRQNAQQPWQVLTVRQY